MHPAAAAAFTATIVRSKPPQQITARRNAITIMFGSPCEASVGQQAARVAAAAAATRRTNETLRYVRGLASVFLREITSSAENKRPSACVLISGKKEQRVCRKILST